MSTSATPTCEPKTPADKAWESFISCITGLLANIITFLCGFMRGKSAARKEGLPEKVSRLEADVALLSEYTSIILSGKN